MLSKFDKTMEVMDKSLQFENKNTKLELFIIRKKKSPKREARAIVFISLIIFVPDHSPIAICRVKVPFDIYTEEKIQA